MEREGDERERKRKRPRRESRSEVPRVRGGSDRSFTRDGRVKTCRSTFYTLLARVYFMSARIYVHIPTGDGQGDNGRKEESHKGDRCARRAVLVPPRAREFPRGISQIVHVAIPVAHCTRRSAFRRRRLIDVKKKRREK